MRPTKYPIPMLLRKLQAFEEMILEETGKDLDYYMGLRFNYEEAENRSDFAYHCEPVDGIELASLGFDGLHFSFLTDYGAVKDLDHAAIVFVEPICIEHHISLIASNLEDFLRLYITTKSTLSMWPKDDSYKDDEVSEEREYICERIKEYFGITPFEDPVAYREKMLDERRRATVLSTVNGLGVVQISSDREHHSFDVDPDGDVDLDELKAFFSEASAESKLACIRDLQEVLVPEDDDELTAFLLEELEKMKLVDEVEMLKIISGAE